MKKRLLFKRKFALEERLAQENDRLREQVKTMQPGPALDQVMERIRQNDAAFRLGEWLKSSGLKPPT